MLAVLTAILRWKQFIASTTTAVTCVTAICLLLVPNTYTAEATILPPQQQQSSLAALASGALGGLASSGLTSQLGLKNPADLYLGMVKSRTVADALISTFHLQSVYGTKLHSDTRRALAARSSFTSGKDSLITISVQDRNPEQAAKLANAYVTELRKLTQGLALTEAAQRRVFFEQQLRQTKDDLANAEVAMKETQQKTGMIDLGSQAKAVIENIGKTRGEIAAREVELRAMRTFATEQNPKYVMLQQELAGLRAQEAKLEREEPGGNGDPVIATAKVPAAALEYVRKLREVKYREALFELLAKQYEAAKLDESRNTTSIQMVDSATEPDRKSAPNRGILTILAFLATAIVSSMYALFREALRDPAHVRTFQILKSCFTNA
jgi:tyrosine-protein kinase Etk/Wzc